MATYKPFKINKRPCDDSSDEEAEEVKQLKIHKRPKDDISDDEEDEKEAVAIPESTKIAISSGYLLSSIIYNYFDKNKCEYMTDNDHKQMIESILDNLFIGGGAARDLLLFRPVNDLDIQCNTRELNKIHLQHLQKYHSTKENQQTKNCSCALWNRYLDKFGQENKEYDAKMLCKIIQNNHKENQNPNEMKASSAYIGKSNYMLNAKFIVTILSESNVLANKIKIARYVRQNGGGIEIIKKLSYNGYDLCGQEFDILDMYKTIPANECNVNQNEKFYERRKSLQITSLTAGKQISKDLVEIDLPILNANPDEHFSHFDLSINCVYIRLLSLMSVIDTFGQFGVKKDGKYEINHAVYNALKSKVKASPIYNTFDDFENKRLTSTLKTIVEHGIQAHFMRVIKFAIRFYDSGWTIDPEIIKHHKKLYKEWIGDDDNVLNVKPAKGYPFVKQFFCFGLAKTTDDYANMIQIFDAFGFNEQLISALNGKSDKHKEFRKEWIETLNQQSNDIVALFKSKGYPIEV